MINNAWDDCPPSRYAVMHSIMTTRTFSSSAQAITCLLQVLDCSLVLHLNIENYFSTFPTDALPLQCMLICNLGVCAKFILKVTSGLWGYCKCRCYFRSVFFILKCSGVLDGLKLFFPWCLFVYRISRHIWTLTKHISSPNPIHLYPLYDKYCNPRQVLTVRFLETHPHFTFVCLQK